MARRLSPQERAFIVNAVSRASERVSTLEGMLARERIHLKEVLAIASQTGFSDDELKGLLGDGENGELAA